MSVLDVTGRSQLLIDRTVVREVRDIAWTLHPAEKHPANPLLKADLPSEGWRTEIYGDVLYDPDDCLFKMWYLGEERDAFPDYGVRYATSRDGVVWEKPPIGTVHSDKYAVHNVIQDQALLGAVLKDDADPDPRRRFKMVGYLLRDKGYHTLVSEDGLNWNRASRETICRGGDVITAYYDESRGRYVAFPKIGTLVRGHKRRVFWVTTSDDFEQWSEPRPAFSPDASDDAGSLARIEEVRPILDRPDDLDLMRTELYGVGAYPAESCTIAFLWMFTINNDARYGNQEGPGELQMAVSRDLDTWDRPFRVPCVPRGEIGEWDCGWFATQSRALRVGDEVWLYYSGANYTHGTPCIYRAEGTGRGAQFTGSIGLAKWHLDRFASAQASSDGGVVTTVPMRFDGSRLEVNATIADGGTLVVRLLDAAGRAVGNSGESDPLTGDSLRHTVTWRGDPSIESISGRPVVAQFEMRSAELFAFRFGGVPS